MPGRLRSAPLRVLVLLVTVGLLFTAGGVVGGWLWERQWTAPTGVAFQHQFVLVGRGPERDFSGTGTYLVIALAVGLALGLTTALVVRGREWLTLAAVVVSSAAAGWLMMVVGHRIGPPDPATLAAGAEDFTRIKQDLTVQGASPLLALPFGAILGLAGGFVLLMLVPLRREPSVDLATLSSDTMH